MFHILTPFRNAMRSNRIHVLPKIAGCWNWVPYQGHVKMTMCQTTIAKKKFTIVFING